MTETFALSRRGILGGGSALLASAALGRSASATPIVTPAARAFPKNFLWGTATAGHQVEGNNIASDMWLLEHVRPTIFTEPSGDACDSLNRWEEDLDIMQALGLNAYRFSVEWSRIEPEPGAFSSAYLDHYARIIEGCHKRGLAPVVTFNHFSVPAWFAARGHFGANDGAALFGRYCDRVARRLASGMAYAMTLNEPNAAAQLHWVKLPEAFGGAMRAMYAAAAQAMGSPAFANTTFQNSDASDKLIAAHIEGFQAIKAARSDLPVGVGLSLDDDQTQGSTVVRDAKRLSVYAPWFAVTRTHGDYIGVQNYGRRVYDANGQIPPPPGSGASGRENLPEALGNAVRYAHEQTAKPVLVTENGISAADDAVRQRYIPRAIAGLHAAIADGVPVLGYIHWSLLDNFEWFSGYREQFGLVALDRTTFQRTVKPSAHVLEAIARANGLRAEQL